ncbi:MAG: glycosyltransferase family 9 protein [Candidatus Omnitrophica bacterium]|nr:glycosyltransferase family 9 protein [Candidatus Omnitrophota bacterium]
MFNFLRRLDNLFIRLAIFAINPKKSKDIQSGEVREILCIKLWGLGNLIVIYPLIEKLKARFPQARITFITFDLNRGFLDDDQSLDRVVYFRFTVNFFRIIRQVAELLKELRALKIDLVINFETFNNASAVFAYLTKAPVRVGINNRYENFFYTHSIQRDPQAHITEVFSDLVRTLGLKFSYAYYSFPVKEQEQQAVERQIKSRPYLCFHPGTSGNFTGKRSREEYFAKLANLFIEVCCIPVYFTGSYKETPIIERIIEKVNDKSKVFNIAGTFTIWELVELMRGCRLFVAGDTGPTHLAASLNVNTVVMFGPSSPKRYSPLNQNSIVFYKGCSCSPCLNPDVLTQTCRKKYECLDFDVQDNFAQISKRFLD